MDSVSRDMHREKQALLYALAAVMLWSTVATAFKLALASYQPLTMLTIACSVSAISLLTVLAHQQQLSAIITLIRQRFAMVLALALLNPMSYYLVLFAAYDRLPGSQAQVINYSWAVVLPIMSALLLKQRLRWFDVVAMLLAYTGVVIIALQGSWQMPNNVTGVSLALLSTLMWASYWVINQKLSTQGPALLAASFVVATPLLWLIAWSQRALPSLSWQGFSAAAYIGLFEMGITFLLWRQALSKTQHTARISNLIFLSPFISLMLLWLVIGEQIKASTVAGLVIIIAAITWQQLQVKRPAPSR